MNSYLSADDILTLLFIEKGMDKEVSDEEIMAFISTLFKIRRLRKRKEIIEIDMPNGNNLDDEIFIYNNDKYNVIKTKQKAVLKNFQNIIYDEELMLEVKLTIDEINSQKTLQRRIR